MTRQASVKYYKKNKEKVKKKPRKGIKLFLQKKKTKKIEYGHESYKNLS